MQCKECNRLDAKKSMKYTERKGTNAIQNLKNNFHFLLKYMIKCMIILQYFVLLKILQTPNLPCKYPTLNTCNDCVMLNVKYLLT